mgnify:CR=1 FL=1
MRTRLVDYAEYDSMIERKDKVLDPGIPAVITNLRIENDEGADITDTLLHRSGYSLMVVSYNLSKTNEPAFKTLNTPLISFWILWVKILQQRMKNIFTHGTWFALRSTTLAVI